MAETIGNGKGGDKVLYIRVPVDIKQELDTIARQRAQPASKVVNRLVEYFVRSTDAQREAILEGNEKGAVNKISHLMMRQGWADHAFNQGRWTWACEEYLELATMSKGKEGNAPGTWRLAQYKLAYCWIEIGIDLQSKAVEYRNNVLQRGRAGSAGSAEKHKKKVAELFDAAEWSIRASIAFNQLYYEYEAREEGDVEYHAVVQYNIACAWALLAKGRIERALDNQILKVRKQEPEHAAEDGTLQSGPWPSGWQEQIAKDDWTGLADEALKHLAELAEHPDTDPPAPPSNRAFLFELANKDPDFAFVARDRELRERFEKIVMPRISSEDVLGAYKKCRALVESTIADMLPDVDAALRGAIR